MDGCCALPQVDTERIGEVLVLRCHGVMTQACIEWVRGVVRGELRDQDARAVVLDMRDVVLLITEASHRALVASIAGETVLPMAVVVSPVYLDLVRRYCLEAAAVGLVRGPFIGEPGAISWASSCREHWPQQARAAASSARYRSQPAAQTAHTLAP